MNVGTISYCVDNPVKNKLLPDHIRDKLKNNGRACPFRVCPIAFARAEQCPTDYELRPTGRCFVETNVSKVYHCLKGQHLGVLVPDKACDTLGPEYCGVGPINFCRCKGRRKKQYTYKRKDQTTPVCPI